MLSNVKNYKNGWFVGDFDPAVFKTKNCEVGIHEYKKVIEKLKESKTFIENS